jgi:hypothetical protein
MLAGGAVLIQQPPAAPATTVRPRPVYDPEDVFTEGDTVVSPATPQRPRVRRVTTATGPGAAAVAVRRARRVRRGVRASVRAAGTNLRHNTPDPTLCALLSFFFPGVGQIVARETGRGVLLIVLAFFAVRGLHLDPFEFVMVVARLVVAANAHRLARELRDVPPQR